MPDDLPTVRLQLQGSGVMAGNEIFISQYRRFSLEPAHPLNEEPARRPQNPAPIHLASAIAM
jgi:hypothetical protein